MRFRAILISGFLVVTTFVSRSVFLEVTPSKAILGNQSIVFSIVVISFIIVSLLLYIFLRVSADPKFHTFLIAGGCSCVYVGANLGVMEIFWINDQDGSAIRVIVMGLVSIFAILQLLIYARPK